MEGEYTTSGATIDRSFITGFVQGEVETSGINLFTSYFIGDSPIIAKYLLDGTAVDRKLITEGSVITGFAISGTDLFFGEGGIIGKYTTSGVLISNPFIGGFENAQGIAVDDSPNAVPEAFSTWWLASAVVGLLALRQRVTA